MQDTDKPKLVEGFTLEKFDNEILLYSEEGTQAVYLNDSAYAVWLLCKEDMTIAEMVDYLEKNYPEQQKQIRGDVFAALNILQENGVIEFNHE